MPGGIQQKPGGQPVSSNPPSTSTPGIGFFGAIGGCNCNPCKPCTLPLTNLTFTYSVRFTSTACAGSGTDSGSATLVFTPGAPNSWLTSCIALPSQVGANCFHSMKGFITCDASTGLTKIGVILYGSGTSCVTPPVAGELAWASDNSGGLPGSWLSYTCSPLSITIQGGAGTNYSNSTWTYTL